MSVLRLFWFFWYNNNVMKSISSKIHETTLILNETIPNLNGVEFHWVNSHTGCKGNEFADVLANTGLNVIKPTSKYPACKYDIF